MKLQNITLHLSILYDFNKIQWLRKDVDAVLFLYGLYSIQFLHKKTSIFHNKSAQYLLDRELTLDAVTFVTFDAFLEVSL